MTNADDLKDLAYDSPLTYAQIRDAQRLGILGGLLNEMTPRERIGAAAVCSERTGKPASCYLLAFNTLMCAATRPQTDSEAAWLTMAAAAAGR
jgi:hypothetical protein